MKLKINTIIVAISKLADTNNSEQNIRIRLLKEIFAGTESRNHEF